MHALMPTAMSKRDFVLHVTAACASYAVGLQSAYREIVVSVRWSRPHVWSLSPHVPMDKAQTPEGHALCVALPIRIQMRRNPPACTLAITITAADRGALQPQAWPTHTVLC